MCYVLQVKKYFEKTGYTCTSDDKPVYIADEEIDTTTVQNITAGWSVEKVQVRIVVLHLTHVGTILMINWSYLGQQC